MRFAAGSADLRQKSAEFVAFVQSKDYYWPVQPGPEFELQMTRQVALSVLPADS